MLTREPRRWPATDDAGMTLIELLVGMSLMLIVATLATTFLVGTTTQAYRVTDQSLSGGTARNAMTQIAAALRVADTPTGQPGYATNRFVVINPGEVEFYSNISPTDRSGSAARTAPSEIDIALTGGKIVESVYAPQSSTAPASYPSTPTSKSVLASSVTSLVFTYCSDATDPSSSCTVTTAPGSVALVQVSMTVSGLNGSTPQTLQSGVAITGAVS